MSGGALVVVDRLGRDVKRYVLAGGLATLGSDQACDIRVLQPSVCKHHATVVVHAAQTVVRNVGYGATLVNGRAVSVAALRHGDVITVGGRALRWEYAAPPAAAPAPPRSPALALAPPRRGRGGRGARRASAAAPPARDRAIQLALEMRHRASMPGSTGGKQVAVVQPQRRDTCERPESAAGRASPQAASRRAPQDLGPPVTESELDKAKRKSSLRTSPKNLLQNTTKATLWIESRKTSPRRKAQAPPLVRARKSAPARKSTPLRLTVLKKAQSARKVIKIEAPLTIDHTKQAAIMLMTGHTPRSKLSISPKQSSSKKSPSYVVKKPSPVRKTPRGKGRQSGRRSGTGPSIEVTPSRGSSFAQGSSNRSSIRSGNRSVTILEITDTTQNSTVRASNISTRSGKSPRKSPSLSSPKKSSMKDHSKKSTRKTESIKFDLSNLESNQDSNDVLAVTNTTRYESDSSLSEDDLTLRYSESSNQSPSPRKSIHSRSSRSGQMLDKLGTSQTPAMPSLSTTLSTESPRARKSIRGSALVQKALESSGLSSHTKMDQTVASAFRTRTLTPRSNRDMESYSVVDLVSFDSNDASKSVYDSAGSTDTVDFGTPANSTGRKSRSTINPTILGSSTPYVGGTRSTRSKSSPNVTQNISTRDTVSTRRSKSLSTPENKHISVNSTKVSRASRSRSRINDSDLLLLDETEVEDSSPKTSKRSRATKSVTKETSNVTVTVTSSESRGVTTPETRHSPEAVGTPVLSIQSLLDSSQSSLTSQNSGRRGRSANYKRKTIGALSEAKRRLESNSKSLSSSVRKTWLRLSKDSSASSDETDEGAPRPDNEDMVTPKSAVKISPEAVKNKHSTAKKPLSKRSIIDDLNQSDFVKQLFNSPVKRKLSQSMTEFSRKQLFEDDDDVVRAKRPTRNTVALTGRTPDDSLLEQTEAITPERFVSPINTPTNSPNLSGLKRLFKKNAPENDLRNVRGVKSLLRTPRPRRSIRNDLTNVRGVKAVFAKSPRNRLSDVRVKEVFAVSPNNDLTDVRGVKRMFQRKSPENDLRNVSGVKRTLRNTTPKNDLTDVRGLRLMFGQEKQKENYHDVSGIEELFNVSNQSVNKSEILFDKLVGKPKIKSVYSKTFSAKMIQKPKTRQARSLRSSIDVTSNNVEEWLERELQKRLHKDVEPSASTSRSRHDSRNTTLRELQKLTTDTLEGDEPIRASRTRNSSYRGKKSASEIYSAHTLPIKKRSLIEASLEKSKHQLPLKKRAVVHSTPVKGRVNLTMNASELGRVSPIAGPGVARSTQMVTDEKAIDEPVKVRTPRKQETPKKIEISKLSPKKSPVQPKRATRNRKTTETSRTYIKKRMSSIVIPKRAPVLSPEADPRATSTTGSKDASSKVSPKKTRATRSKKEEKLETPKRTRARVAKATVIVLKPSPKLKPTQSKEKVVQKSQPKELEQKRNKTRKTIAVKAKAESPKVSQSSNRTRANANVNEPQTRGRKTKIEKPAQVSQIKKPAQAKRGRKTVEMEQPLQPKRGRKTNAVDPSVQESSKTRGRKVAAVANSKTEDKQPKGRGKKVEIQASVQSEPTTRGRGKRIEPAVEEKELKTRGRKFEIGAKKEEITTKTRGKKAENQSSAQSEQVPRGRRNKAEEILVPKTLERKRKAAANEEVPSKVAKAETKRGKKAEVSVTETTGRQKRAVAKRNKVENGKDEAIKSTRGTKSKQVAEVEKPIEKKTKPVRGRKAAEPKEQVVETVRGKRKANVEPSPAKVAAKKPATKATVKPAPSPIKTRARPARGKPQPEVPTKAVGRSRRR